MYLKLKQHDFQSFCKEVLRQGKNINLIGDKNPSYSLFGNSLIESFPEAKFIWLIRDYRAQVNSMLKVNFERKIVTREWYDLLTSVLTN